MFRNLKLMPGVLKWVTALCLVPPVFTVGTLIPNGTVNVDGKPMANSAFWASGAGTVVASSGIVMIIVAALLLKRSRYARLVALVGFALTCLSGRLIPRLLHPEFVPSLLWLSGDLITVALLAWYLFGNTAVRNYFQSTSNAGKL
jgi:hypothetical protein